MSYKVLEEFLTSESNKSASFNSSTVDMRGLNQGSFQVNITTGGAVSWTVVVQGSNDNTNFVNLNTPTAVTGSDNLIFGFGDLSCLYYRVAFTRTSGTLSTATVHVGAKG